MRRSPHAEDGKQELQNRQEQEGEQMADKTSLGIVGFILAGVTAGVFTVATWLVTDHVAGRLQLESSHSVAEISATRVR
jgi:hypothetical protein